MPHRDLADSTDAPPGHPAYRQILERLAIPDRDSTGSVTALSAFRVRRAGAVAFDRLLTVVPRPFTELGLYVGLLGLLMTAPPVGGRPRKGSRGSTMAKAETKIAQVNLRIKPSLKQAAERA